MKNKEPKYLKGKKKEEKAEAGHKYLKEKKKKKRSGKKLCIFLMVVFTLVMIADVANLFLTPAQNPMGFGPGGGFSMPKNGDFQMPDGMEMPEGGDFQIPEGMEMPSGGDFQMPDGMEMPDSDTAGNEIPAEDSGTDTAFEGRPGGNRGGRQGGFLQTARRLWLPILIICALGDLICLMILIRIGRKEKALKQAFDNESGLPPLIENEEEEDDDAPPRRKTGSWVVIVCLAVTFAMILSMFPTGEDSASTATVHQELISGTAGAAEINTVLSGAGTLKADTLTPVTVPQQVTVLNYHVRNGETVAAGDPLVSVDKTSAAAAVMELNELMEELDDDLSSAKTDSQSARIASTTSGRVKKIYGWEGEKVADVLYEHGALMLLSLDGYMKVTFESEKDLSVGDTVEVRYSGGTEEGRIATVRMGKVTVTLSDKTAPYGADATIVDEDGNTIGEGKLEINSEMKIIGYYGTIEQVRVNVGDKVTADNTLFSLENVGYTTEYQILLARRNELEQQLQTLSKLARTGMIYAENDGVISGVPDDADIELLSGNGNSAVTANNLAATSGGWKVVLLTSVTPSTTTSYRAAKITKIEGTMVTVNYFEDGTVTDQSDPSAFASSIADTNVDALNTSTDFTNITTTPVVGDYLLYAVTKDSTGNITVRSVLKHVTASSEPSTPTTLNGYYAAKLESVVGSTYSVRYYPTNLEGNATTLASVDLTSFESGMTTSGTFTSTAVGDVSLNGTTTVSVTDLQTGDLVLLKIENDWITQVVKAQRTTPNQPTDPSGGQTPGGTQGGMPSGGMPSGGTGTMPSGGAQGAMPSGGSGFSGGMPSGMGGSMEQTYDNYIVEETELLYVSDQEEVSVTISIDELDILSVAVGMEVQVTLDAVKGQAYQGKIIRIGHEGTNDGGNTKYEVTILLPRAAVMLDGMNASVSIVTGTSNAAVTIPAAALIEDDGKTYVYTSYDAETDTLGGLVEVETGASDGNNVEILSGLDAGDTYYYLYSDTVTYHFLTVI